MSDGAWEEAPEALGDERRPTGKVRRHLHLWVAAGLGITVLGGLAAQSLIGRVGAAVRPAQPQEAADRIVLGQAPAMAALQQELVHEQLADPAPPPLPDNIPDKTDAEAAHQRELAEAEAQRQASIAASPILALSNRPFDPVRLAMAPSNPGAPDVTPATPTNAPTSLGTALNNGIPLPALGNLPWPPGSAPNATTSQPPAATVSPRSQHNTLPLEPEAPASPILVLEGTVIPAVLLTQINSDLPGLITAQVTEDVYDSLQGDVLAIPKGTRVIGTFGAHILPGQERLMASFHRLILPSGVSYTLEDTVASDAIGQSGMEDKVDNRFWKRLGGQFMTAGLARVIEQPSGGVTVLGGMGNNLTTDAAGQILVNTASIGFAADAAIGPVIIIRKGYPFTLLVNRDMDFSKAPH